MIETTFLGKEVTPFDDVTFTSQIKTDTKVFTITITFCGGINEDGEEDLYGSMCADISVQEINAVKDDLSILKTLFDRYYKDENFAEYEAYTNGSYMTFKNESCYDSSVSDFYGVIGNLTSLIMETYYDVA